MMRRYKVPGELLELELTENIFVENQDELFATIEAMKQKRPFYSQWMILARGIHVAQHVKSAC